MHELKLYNYRNEAVNPNVKNYYDNFRVYATYPNFFAHNHEISCATGGKCDFTLQLWPAMGGKPYIILSGMTGMDPGFDMAAGTIHVPLNADFWTYMAFNFYPYWPGFQSFLDANGVATATLDTFTPLPSSAIGLAMYFDYLVLKSAWSTPIFSSFPVYVLFLP